MSPSEYIQSWLSGYSLGVESSGILSRIILGAAVLLISCIAFYVSRRIVGGVVHLIFKRTRFTWDDRLLESNLFMRLTLLVPVLIIHIFIPLVLDGTPQAGAVATGAVNIYFICVAMLIIDALLNALHAI